jgi:hypothetical protein
VGSGRGVSLCGCFGDCGVIRLRSASRAAQQGPRGGDLDGLVRGGGRAVAGGGDD